MKWKEGLPAEVSFLPGYLADLTPLFLLHALDWRVGYTAYATDRGNSPIFCYSSRTELEN